MARPLRSKGRGRLWRLDGEVGQSLQGKKRHGAGKDICHCSSSLSFCHFLHCHSQLSALSTPLTCHLIPPITHRLHFNFIPLFFLQDAHTHCATDGRRLRARHGARTRPRPPMPRGTGRRLQPISARRAAPRQTVKARRSLRAQTARALAPPDRVAATCLPPQQTCTNITRTNARSVPTNGVLQEQALTIVKVGRTFTDVFR